MEQSEREENSMTEIRIFFEEGTRPLVQHEFLEFWKACTPEERIEFKKADLSA